MDKFLLLITSSPDTPNAKHALDVATDKLQRGDDVRVFFYGDGAYVANRLRWQSADVADVADGWIRLHDTHALSLPVCVGTALARGITDKDNATRHGLDGDNLRLPFYLVGLSKLALGIDDATTLMQF